MQEQVTMDTRVYLPSTWRDAIGKPLTNAVISRYQRAGWYGPVVRERALKNFKPTNGQVFRCECGCKDEVRYLTYTYLPRPGYYCPRCIAVHRTERDKDKELKRRWLEACKREYV